MLLHHRWRPANQPERVSCDGLCYYLKTPASYHLFLCSTQWFESQHVPLGHVPYDRPAIQFISVCGQSYAQTASLTPYKSIIATLHAWRGPHRSQTPLFSWSWRHCALKKTLIQPPVWLGKITLLHPEWCSEAHWHLWRESAQFIGPEAINMVRDYIHFLCKKTLCFSPGGTGYEA